jgi:hypothetical protein
MSGGVPYPIPETLKYKKKSEELDKKNYEDELELSEGAKEFITKLTRIKESENGSDRKVKSQIS